MFCAQAHTRIHNLKVAFSGKSSDKNITTIYISPPVSSSWEPKVPSVINKNISHGLATKYMQGNCLATKTSENNVSFTYNLLL